MTSGSKKIPQYQRIKNYLLEGIAEGRWAEGDAVPSEQALAQQFAVSRMTVNRAVRELADERVLTRVQGSGTYVAPQKYQATLIEIKSIADEVRDRGHSHSSQVLTLDAIEATEPLVHRFQVKPGHLLYHSLIVHFDNGVPIQTEERWANAELAPDYLIQDFSHITPNEYLMKAAPLQKAEYRVEAISAPATIAKMLHIPKGEPCLVINRRTWSQERVASVATMWYPGSRYQLEGAI